ncbi:uncharacterized protein [Prorops nasuta]
MVDLETENTANNSDENKENGVYEVIYHNEYSNQEEMESESEIIINNTDEHKKIDSKIVWDSDKIKFLLKNYHERIEKFRNPKIKNLSLWREIEIEFQKMGYLNITGKALDRKLRNLKCTYKTIKNKRNGRGPMKWEWYCAMDEIFTSDKSVNFDESISSVDDSLNPLNYRKRKFSSILSNNIDVNHLQFFCNCLDSCSCDELSYSDVESIPEGPSTSRKNLGIEESSDEASFEEASLSRSESYKRRKFYNQRARAINLKEKQIDILKNIEIKYIENQNKIEENFNKFIELQNRRIKAMEKRNEILKRNNDLLSKQNEILIEFLTFKKKS